MSGPRHLRLLASLCVLPLLQGCALLQDGGPGAPPVAPPAGATLESELPQLLHYYRQLVEWPEAVLEAEQRIQRAALTEGRCEAPRLKLGLAILRGAERGLAPVGKIDELLEPCLRETAVTGTGTEGLADLLSTQLRRAATARSQAQTNAQALDALQKENQELKRQLEGLKAIERSLQDRRRR